MTDELKPCPFCGSEACFSEDKDDEIIIQCTNEACGVQSKSFWPCYRCEREKSCKHTQDRERYVDCDLVISDIETLLTEIWNRRVNK